MLSLKTTSRPTILSTTTQPQQCSQISSIQRCETYLPSTAVMKEIPHHSYYSLITTIGYCSCLDLGKVQCFANWKTWGKEENETAWCKLELILWSHKLLSDCRWENLGLPLFTRSLEPALAKPRCLCIVPECTTMDSQKLSLLLLGTLKHPRRVNPCLMEFGVSVDEMDADQRKC